eukprot:7969019-Heterocapsa_arctica.AAC.1
MGEIHGGIAGVELAQHIAIVLCDFTTQRSNDTKDLMNTAETSDGLLPVDWSTDAYDIFSASASQQTAFTDRHAVIYMHWLRNEIENGRVRHIFWNTTGDMLVDGLTKAGVTESIRA